MVSMATVLGATARSHSVVQSLRNEKVVFERNSCVLLPPFRFRWTGTRTITKEETSIPISFSARQPLAHRR